MGANHLTGRMDRAVLFRRDREWLAVRLGSPASRLIPVWRSQSLVRRADSKIHAVRLRVAEAPRIAVLAAEPLFLGVANGEAHFAIDLSPIEDPLAALGLAEPDEFVDLRRVGGVLSGDDGALLAYARALTHWHHHQQFCGRCGAPTESRDGGHMRVCTGTGCGTEHFPRTDPAAIVLVSAGDKCLLGRQSRWPPGMFSALAGFVEPGETAEQAVVREVMEETGVPVARVRYHSSQSWPFPASLMIGFMAEADEAVEPRLDEELEAAAWFSRADLAGFSEKGLWLPDRYSIARQLIEAWRQAG